MNSCQAMYPFFSSWQLAIRGSADLVTPIWMGLFLTGLLAPLLPTASRPRLSPSAPPTTFHHHWPSEAAVSPRDRCRHGDLQTFRTKTPMILTSDSVEGGLCVQSPRHGSWCTASGQCVSVAVATVVCFLPLLSLPLLFPPPSLLSLGPTSLTLVPTLITVTIIVTMAIGDYYGVITQTRPTLPGHRQGHC